MVKKRLAVVSAALLVHGVAYAASGTADCATTGAANGDTSRPDATWAVQGQAGLIMTRSNTTTKSGNGSFVAAHAMGRWTLSGGLAGLYASSAGITTQQDLNTFLQSDLQLSKRTFWFSTARWDRNLFSGFAYQESLATGAGFNIVRTPATQLTAELGAGYRRQQPEVIVTSSTGEVIARMRQPVVDDAVMQAALKYEHAISSSTKLLNTVLVVSGSSDTTTTDNLSLQVKVDASLSLAVGMQLVNNSSPPPGSARHTDTVMTVNLVYELKNPRLSVTGTAPQAVSDLNLP
jgi:putative salt-induced outer membrane protein